MTSDPKPDTWMPIVIGDYLKDTKRLTTEQHGAYLLLLMDYWVNGPPADDDEELAAITGLEPKAWKKNRPKLERYFKIEGGRWRNKRADEELLEAAERKRKNAERASAGGRAKAAKRCASSSAPSSASSTIQAAENAPKSLLKSCSASIPTEVDAPTGQSTLCGRESVEARLDGASPLRVIDGGQDDSERTWTLLAYRARDDKLRNRVSDPDLSSEFAEFEAFAHGQAIARRRAAA